MTGPHARTLADQHAYLNAGLRPLACDSCPALVRVKKNSALHTSIQWTVQAVRQCVELDGPESGLDSCPRLRASIDLAVQEGRLDVPTTPRP